MHPTAKIGVPGGYICGEEIGRNVATLFASHWFWLNERTQSFPNDMPLLGAIIGPVDDGQVMTFERKRSSLDPLRGTCVPKLTNEAVLELIVTVNPLKSNMQRESTRLIDRDTTAGPLVVLPVPLVN